MSIRPHVCTFTAIAVLTIGSVAVANHTPQHERQQEMEQVGKAAKPIGLMFRGEREFDAGIVRTSLQTFLDTSAVFGDLFPEGSESGEETEAAPAIWEDREGFEDALDQWRGAVEDAIDSEPQTLDEAKPVIGPVFKACKNCHDNYRIDKD